MRGTPGWPWLLAFAAPAAGQLVFEPPLELTTDVLTDAVSTGDVNEDGLDDAALVEGFGVRHLRVLLSQGDGSFALAFSDSVGIETPRLDLVDVDDDGHLDLLYGDTGGTNFGVRVRLGAGDASFGPDLMAAAAGPAPTHFAFGHLDEDSVLDMVAANVGTLPSASFPPDLDVLLGDGDGTFTLAHTKPLPAASVAPATGVGLADVDEDGDLDVAVLLATGAVWVHRGFGNGGFSAATQLAVASSGAGLALADLDGDGHVDLLVADASADAVALRLGLGGGDFGPAVTVPFGDAPSGLAVADLDGDEVPDLVVTQAGLGDVGTRRGLGDGSFGPLVTVSGTPRPASPRLARVDADDRPDLVLVETGALLPGPNDPGALVSVLNHTYAEDAPFLDLGHALPGANGFPILLAEGTLVAGTPYSFTIANGVPGGTTSLVAGASAILAPFKGGTYVPFPQVQIAGLPLDGAGALEFSGSWPALGSGLELFLQSWAKDPGGPQGWSATSGLRLALP